MARAIGYYDLVMFRDARAPAVETAAREEMRQDAEKAKWQTKVSRFGPPAGGGPAPA